MQPMARWPFRRESTTMENLKSVDELCAQHGIDAKQLAARSGLDERRVRAITEGRWTPSPAERDKIAAVFGLTRDQIAWGHKTTVEHIHGHGPQFGRSP
jgi:transcriptional regulator with XRE-family HTH domain